ncbi:hypothetical protein D3C75_1162250 [compost metagenome]
MDIALLPVNRQWLQSLSMQKSQNNPRACALDHQKGFGDAAGPPGVQQPGGDGSGAARITQGAADQ